MTPLPGPRRAAARFSSSATQVSGSAQSGFITRLDSDGTTDTAFGSGGITSFRFLGRFNTVPTGVAIDPTTGDAAVVCGVIGSGVERGRAFIAKFDTSGNLITSFATNGFETFAPGNARPALSFRHIRCIQR